MDEKDYLKKISDAELMVKLRARLLKDQINREDFNNEKLLDELSARLKKGRDMEEAAKTATGQIRWKEKNPR